MAGVNNSTESEVSELKSKYGPSCRVINNCGDFKHMVSITPQASEDLTIKFQITEAYPEDLPQVIVLSGCHDSAVEQEVTQFLTSSMEEHRGLPSLLVGLLAILEEWLENTKAGAKAKSAQGNDKLKDKKQKNKKSKDKSKKQDEENVSSKKSSMKTAVDVISRILWDSDLPQECFKIGYLDRFTGIVEKGFEAFSWEDIASVDYETLAIPKHRIQYFKYKEEIVWDKSTRLDNIFGSTGGGLTITDVIRRYEAGGGTTVHDGNDGVNHNTDSDSDDDDAIVVRVPEVKYNLGVPKSTTTETVKNEVCDKAESNDDEDDWKDNSSRPNYFVAIRVTDPEILSAAKSVQDAMVQLEPALGECAIPQEALHITLCTLRLDTTEQIADAARCLQNTAAELKTILDDNCPLKFWEMDNFRNRVLFAKVYHDSSFVRFVDLIRKSMEETGLALKDVYSFRPHMTLVKMSRTVSRLLCTREIDAKLYQGLENIHFGQQTIDAVHLCSMRDAHRDDGFYHTVTSVEF